MKIRKFIVPLLVCMLCSGILSGCSTSNSESSQQPGSTNPNQQSDSTSPSSSTSSPAEKVHPVLNLRISTDVTSLDPHVTTNNEEYGIFTQVFDGLVRFDGSKSEAIPDLATDWSISDDGTEYTFSLREAKWHDGSDFTADDVVFSVERFLSMPATSNKAAFVTGAEKIDEHTVKIKLEYAYPNFVLQLCSYPWRIVSQKAIETYGDDNKDMLIGTGPYKLQSITSGVGATLVENPDYWGQTPYFETLNYKLIPDNTTALTALLNGEIDLDSVSSDLDVDYVKKTDGYTIHEFQRAGGYVIAMDLGKAPFDNELFRQAVSHAINKDEYIQLVWKGQAYPGGKTLISDYEEGYTDAIPSYDYDVQKAKELIAQSGLSQQETSFELIVPTSSYGPAFGAAFQESMKAVGINVILKQVEAGSWRSQFFAGEYQSIVYNLASVPYNPPLFYRSYLKPSGYICRNSTLELDDKIDAANRELDDAKRNEMYQEINVVVGEACNYIPIAYQKMSFACPENLKGMEWHRSLMTTNIADWYWEE